MTRKALHQSNCHRMTDYRFSFIRVEELDQVIKYALR
jgi:hypothetical protein